jgi:hypothetical protein
VILEVVFVSDRSRSGLGKASRGVLAEIEARLENLDEQLAGHAALLQERERLLAARATLLGETPVGQVTQEDIAGYLAEHPGSQPREIAQAFGVSSGRVSAHLFRGKQTRFVSRGDGWHLREKPTKARGQRSGGRER